MGIYSWIAIFALFLHLPPLVRLLGRPLRGVMGSQASWPPNPLWVKLGLWEYLLGPLRDQLFFLLLLAWMVYGWFAKSFMNPDILLATALILLFCLMAVFYPERCPFSWPRQERR